MNRKNRELLKTYILLALSAAALIQVGILWDYQNHRFPFNFISTFFSTTKLASGKTVNAEEYNNPYRIIVSGGAEQSHWIVDIHNEYYNALKKEAITYLERILTSKQSQSKPADEVWWDAVTKKAVIIEFKTDIGKDMMAYYLGMESSGLSSGAPEGVYKIAILPWEESINNLNTLYVLHGEKVYSYTMPFKGSFTRDDYETMIKKFTDKTGDKGYYVAIDSNMDKFKFDFVKKDLLLSITGYEELQNVVGTIPGWLWMNDKDDIEDVEDHILGKEKDSFDSPASSDNKFPWVFKNVNNIYRVYKDGIMEYRYISTSGDEEKSNIRDAFERALEYVSDRKKSMVSGVDNIILSDVKESGKNFEFDFDYIVNGKPVFTEYSLKDKRQTPVHSALIIKANSKRVVECWWALREFYKSNETSKKYNVNFPTLLDKTFERYKELDKKERNFMIDDLDICYYLKPDEEVHQVLSPFWNLRIINPQNTVKYYNVPIPLSGK